MATKKAANTGPNPSATTRASFAKQKTPLLTDPASPANPGGNPSGQLSIADLFRGSPTTASGARTFLLSHRLLDDRDDVITPAYILNVLTHILKRPDVSPVTAAHIDSVALLLPGAIELGINQAGKLQALSEKLDKLLEQGIGHGEPPDQPNYDSRLAEMESKLGALTTLIEKSQASAGAAEFAAIETQKSLRELHQSAAAGAGGTNASGPVLPDPSTFAEVTAGDPPRQSADRQARPLSVKKAVASEKRAQSQGCHITVNPSSRDAADKLSACSARTLVEKADSAFEAAWKALAPTPDFVGKPRPRITFRTARVLAKGGVRYDMGDRAQAIFLSHASVASEFERAFGEVSCTGQGAVVLLQCAPTDWTPDDPSSLRALESKNQLESGTVMSASWAKLPTLRKEGQLKAVVKLWLRSQKIADDLIIHGGQLLNAPVLFRMMRQEPTRCYRCQKFGHKGVKCKALYEVCSGCGGPHSAGDCDKTDVSHCVSCNTDTHCSWDRKCPAYKSEMEKMKRHKPETTSMLYDPAREAELIAPRARPLYLAPATLGEARISIAASNALRPARNARLIQPRLPFSARARADTSSSATPIPGRATPPHMRSPITGSPKYALRPVNTAILAADPGPASPTSIASDSTS